MNAPAAWWSDTHELMPGSAAIPQPTGEDVASHWVGCLRIETTNPPAANTVVCTAASEMDSPRKLLCSRTFHDANSPYLVQSHGPLLHSFFVWHWNDAHSDVVTSQADTQQYHEYCCLRCGFIMVHHDAQQHCPRVQDLVGPRVTSSSFDFSGGLHSMPNFGAQH